MATTVLNPSGSSGSCYVQTLTDTAAVSIDNNRAIPGGFGNPFTVQGKNVYVFPDYMGQSKAALQRFVIDANHQLVKAGEMMLPAGSAASQVIEVNDHTAYVSCQNLGKVLVFDFKQMKQTGEIDLNSLSGTGVRVGPSCMIVRDGKVFIALSQFNAQWMPAKNSIEFAMVDAQTNRLEKHIKNESLGLAFPSRPIDRKATSTSHASARLVWFPASTPALHASKRAKPTSIPPIAYGLIRPTSKGSTSRPTMWRALSMPAMASLTDMWAATR